MQAHLCPALCNSMDYSPPGSSVLGILQVRILEWVATPSSKGSSRHRDQTLVSCVSWIGRWILYHLPPRNHLGSPIAANISIKKIIINFLLKRNHKISSPRAHTAMQNTLLAVPLVGYHFQCTILPTVSSYQLSADTKAQPFPIFNTFHMLVPSMQTCMYVHGPWCDGVARVRSPCLRTASAPEASVITSSSVIEGQLFPDVGVICSKFPKYGSFPGGASGKDLTCQCRRCKSFGFDPWVEKTPLGEEMATHSSILAWEILQRSLVGYSP